MARKIRAIFWIGLAAGTLDITENLVFNHFRGISPWRVFQYIASGLIGMKSFQSGWSSVALGFAIHCAIALTWTGIFLFAALKFSTITRRPLLSGVIYGCLVYLIMTFMVLPLSGVRIRRPRSPLRQDSTPCWLLFSVLDCPSRFSRAEHLMKQQTH